MDKEDKFLHNLRKSEKSQHQIPSHHAWDRIHKTIESKKSRKFFNRSLYWQGMAASFLLICFLSVIYYFFTKPLNKPDIAKAETKETIVKPIYPEPENEAIAENNKIKPDQSDKLPGNTDQAPIQKKLTLPAPTSLQKSKPAESITSDQSLTAAPLAAESQNDRRARETGGQVPSAAMRKAEPFKEAAGARSKGVNLIPVDASGNWAGTLNGTNYTARLKNINNTWILTGHSAGNEKSTDKIIIEQNRVSVQTIEGTEVYEFSTIIKDQAHYRISADLANYVVITYREDKLEIFQSKSTASGNTPNHWKLVKSYE